MAARTFVDLSDLVEWLEVHGHEPGDIITDILESAHDEPWLVANEVAEGRARLRLGHLEAQHFKRAAWTDEAGLRNDLHAARLHIAHLTRQLDEARRGGRPADKPVRERERRTFLLVIAALCRQAGIDYSARGAAMEVASATAELGSPVSDDTIRPMLKAIPNVLG